MGFEGSVLDAINRLKYNRSLITSRRERYRRVREVYQQTHLRYSGEVGGKQIPARQVA